jgi:hypothetical protein
MDERAFFSYTAPKVVATEAKGFGEGEHVRGTLGALRALGLCSWSGQKRTPEGRLRRWRRSRQREELSSCLALGTSELSWRAIRRSRTRAANAAGNLRILTRGGAAGVAPWLPGGEN